MLKPGASLTLFFLFLTAAPSARADADDPPETDYELPTQVGLDEMQSLLQRFVDETYPTAFRLLGDSRDFDHGHFLYAENLPTNRKPFAVLWHTQERGLCKGMQFQFDPTARNWIQWLDPKRPLQNAIKYKRRAYPATPAWRALVELRLSDAEECHTIHPEMLDPEALGLRVASTSQWSFTKKDCEEIKDNRIDISLPPNGARICLEVSQSGYGDYGRGAPVTILKR